jgi:hypothetical protein
MEAQEQPTSPIEIITTGNESVKFFEDKKTLEEVLENAVKRRGQQETKVL